MLLTRLTVSATLMAVSWMAQSTETLTTDVRKNLIVEQGGYTQVRVDTNVEQKYPLLSVSTFQLPGSIKYVGQSLNYILSLSGYRLENLRTADQKVIHLYSMKVPLTNRSFKQATVLQIVETIVGVGYTVEVDEVAREIKIKVAKGA
ncbi:hypothetical protein [Enterovibrio norvegicus]|uniref:hypothetical protein n=1 Tax=Enterovibrio norvegicus TaxID=188144 RepID=UPI000C82E8F3|nr:hypothetical protein [Enterovibrio norvegicus]PMH64564.1 hypothetical protein BCU62_16035 [Enterovibrio norvegicus]